MKLVYLDHAATTSVLPEVLFAMKPYFATYFGNPSQPHISGQQAKKALEQSRTTVAKFLKASSEEIIFTSCATESINLAHKGLMEALFKNFTGIPHIITTSIEHKAVLETCKHLEKMNLAKVTYLLVDKYGEINLEGLEGSITPQTVLVSVMYVNNEVGTIQPISKIGLLLKKLNQSKKQKIYFHTDATQAIQYLNCDVNFLGVDLLSLTGHKIGAPKGIGALYVKSNTPLARQIDGGNQEKGLRSGTENVPYIVGLAKAVEQIIKTPPNQINKLTQLQEYLIKEVLKIPGINLTGHPQKRVPHLASFIIKDTEGESLVLMLSNKGIMVSTGSACTSNTLSPSHVLTAMGIAPQDSHGSLRVSLNKSTTKAEIDYFLKELPKIIEKLRVMSPKL